MAFFSSMTPPEVLTLVGVLTGAIVTIINAIGSWWGRQAARNGRQRADVSAEVAHTKLDEIKVQTNGRYDDLVKRLTEVELQLALLRQKGGAPS